MTILKVPLQSPPPATIASIPLVSSWALVDTGLAPGLLSDGGQSSKGCDDDDDDDDHSSVSHCLGRGFLYSSLT